MISPTATGYSRSPQTRTPAKVDTLLEGLEPVAPGVVNLKRWRPDPNQPALDPVPAVLRPYVGVTETSISVYEDGGVLRQT